MWQRFKGWWVSPLGSATTNGVAALIWYVLAASVDDSNFVRWLSGFNAVMFAFLSGGKVMEHVNSSFMRMKDMIIEQQHSMIRELIDMREPEIQIYNDLSEEPGDLGDAS